MGTSGNYVERPGWAPPQTTGPAEGGNIHRGFMATDQDQRELATVQGPGGTAEKKGLFSDGTGRTVMLNATPADPGDPGRRTDEGQATS